MAILNKIRPGDWLYIYNANASGEHSVMFSRWTSDVKKVDGFQYREAVVFDQGLPKHGGRESNTKLGEAYHISKADPTKNRPKIRIVPVTHIARVNPAAKPASKVSDIAAPDKSQGRLAKRFFGKRGKKLNVAALFKYLRNENAKHIATIKHRLTPNQLKMMLAGNQTNDLQQLVNLSYRLRLLAKNVSGYDKRFASHRQKVNQDYGTQKGKADNAHAAIDAKIATATKRLKEIKAQKVELEQQKAMARFVKHIVLRIAERKKLRKIRKKSPEIRKRIRQLSSEIRNYLQARQKNRRTILMVVRELNKVKLAERRVKYLLTRYKRSKGKIDRKKLPFIKAQPGNIHGAALRRRITLTKLLGKKVLATFMIPLTKEE